MTTTADTRSAVLAVLAEIAPEADLALLSDDADLRDELDLDSLDLQNLVEGIHARLGVDVPERDYGRLTTLAATSEYLAARMS